MKKKRQADPLTNPSPALAQWLAQLEQLDPSRIKLGLERVADIHQRLALPRSDLTLLIAGTNGKGSSALFLDRLLTSAGYSVGRYTSPHLCRFNERVVVNGQPAADDALVAAFERIERIRGDVELSYFEFTTLAALLVFADSGVSARVLEIGLGGRLDAVNAVTPDACLLTNVGLDHQQWLGDDLESIGREKAAIFRAGLPAVVSSRAPPSSVRASAEAVGASLLLLGTDFDCDDSGAAWRWRGRRRMLEGLPPDMAIHQRHNASGCLAVLESIGVLERIDDAAIVAALAAGNGPGRLEVFEHRPQLLLDVSHNVEATGRLAEWLAAHPVRGGNTLVFGAMRDKPVAGMLTQLQTAIDRWIAVAATGARPLRAEEVAGCMARTIQSPALVAGSPVAGYRAARRMTPHDGRIIVAGSFPVVGAVRGQL